MSWRRCSVSGSIEIASISFSRTPIGSSNSSSLRHAGVNGRVTEPAPQSLARPAPRASCGDGSDADLRHHVGADAQLLAAPRRFRAQSPPADRPDWRRAGPRAPRASGACSRHSAECARPSTSARAALERKELDGLHPGRFVVAFELAAHRHQRAVLDERREPGIGLGKRHDLERPCASSSMKTPMRSPFLVLSGRKPETIPPTCTSSRSEAAGRPVGGRRQLRAAPDRPRCARRRRAAHRRSDRAGDR